MTTMIKPDTRGIDALCGELDDNVTPLPTLIFDQLAAEMAQQFTDAPWPDELPTFDAAPWDDLPTVADLEPIWSASTPIDAMISRLGVSAHGDGEDLMSFMARQWWLAGLELDLKRRREAEGDQADVDNGGAGTADGPVGSAAPGRGGGAVSGGPENGDTVGEGGQVAGGTDSGAAPAVPRKRRSRKAGG